MSSMCWAWHTHVRESERLKSHPESITVRYPFLLLKDHAHTLSTSARACHGIQLGARTSGDAHDAQVLMRGQLHVLMSPSLFLVYSACAMVEDSRVDHILCRMTQSRGGLMQSLVLSRPCLIYVFPFKQGRALPILRLLDSSSCD